MRGQIKVGRWLPFRARETLDPHHGLTWTARAAEAIWVPTALLARFGVDWSAGDERHITARYRIETVQVEVHYALDAGGHVRSVVFDRWGDPRAAGAPGVCTRSVARSARTPPSALSIPSAGRFGWFFGTDRWSQGEFFRYQITGLRLGSAQ
jgi:hypothetical protein